MNMAGNPMKHPTGGGDEVGASKVECDEDAARIVDVREVGIRRLELRGLNPVRRPPSIPLSDS